MCFTLLSVKVYFINLVLVIQVSNACNLFNKLRIMKLSQLKNPGYCSLNSLDKKAFNSCFRNWTEMHVSLIDLRFELNVTEIIGFKSARYFLIRHASRKFSTWVRETKNNWFSVSSNAGSWYLSFQFMFERKAWNKKALDQIDIIVMGIRFKNTNHNTEKWNLFFVQM